MTPEEDRVARIAIREGLDLVHRGVEAMANEEPVDMKADLALTLLMGVSREYQHLLYQELEAV